MIAVIADDLTGAAELAGISLRFGLRVHLFTAAVKQTDADVLIVSTDSRSRNRQEALDSTAKRLKELLALSPDFIYKKTDSVLRGHVTEELNLQLQLEKKSRAVLLPANPSLGRSIREGIYYIHGTPVSETSFANDPEFPIKQATVTGMLRDDSVHCCKPGDVLPENGIVVTEAETLQEVQGWSYAADEKTVLAGAGDFYAALLQQRYSPQNLPQPEIHKPFLYVCGTAYESSVAFVKKAEPEGLVSYISNKCIHSPGQLDQVWVNQTNQLFRENGKLILAIDGPSVPEKVTAVALRTAMAKATQWIIRRNIVHELFIEGGSTATAVLQELNITELEPVGEWQRGVVRMKTGNLIVTVKPGSYALPQKIKELFS